MADTIRLVQYFYSEVADKPGKGAQLLQMLQEAGLNLVAFSGFPKGKRAQIDFIPADPVAFKTVAKKAKLKLVGPKSGFLIQGEDRVGALTEVLAKLTDAKINVTACDAVAAGAGRYGAILWVKPRDVQKATKVLNAS
jgi:hypothetical protein